MTYNPGMANMVYHNVCWWIMYNSNVYVSEIHRVSMSLLHSYVNSLKGMPCFTKHAHDPSAMSAGLVFSDVKIPRCTNWCLYGCCYISRV